jgi:hypothetical protein
MDSGTLLTPTALIARVREVDRLRRAADLELLELAVAWADAHPDPHETPEVAIASGRVDPACLDALGNEESEPHMWRGLPGIAWDAAAALGTALGRSTGSAERLIRDGLILRHRLPRLWAMVQDGAIEAFRARRVADLVAGHPDDVCAHVDEQVAPIAATAGVVTLDRLLDEALLTLHADQVELDRLEALDARHVTVDESSINHTGVADLSARADWADLSAFDDAVGAVAARLAEQDEADGLPPESLDIRRARALGILADPASAQALLEGKSTPARSRRTDLLLHLSTDALQNRSFFGRDGRLDMTLLADAVRDWCGRSDTDLHVHPVIDLNEHERVDQHDASAPMATRIELSHPTCVFPWCTRPARRCDKDHQVPYDAGGATCDCNLTPLCRRHHRLKTHRGFRYTIIEPGTWLWRTPHGLQLIRDRGGTRDVTPDPPPGTVDQPWDGCLAGLG